MSSQPTLWHIPISHFSEKARWALEYKGIAYRKIAPVPGAHMAIAGALTLGRSITFPILRIDGTTVSDSSEIIAELERLQPEPPLYPDDAGELRRALALEDYFDENLGPAIRRMVWHHLRQEPALMGDALADDLPGPLVRNDFMRAGASRFAATFVNLRYRAGDESGAREAERIVLESLDRLETEIEGREYLAGDTFSVADLTAAALFYPLVSPPEGPRQVTRPSALERFCDEQRQRAGYQWVAGIWASHRNRRPVAA